ncbi:MAG: hypothetical protein AABZ27_00450, partial [Candidatus Omnitrophota bacterium]
VSAQAVSQLIHSTKPLRRRRIDTAYGNYQTLEVEYTKSSLGTQMSIFVELAGGKPVRFAAPSRIIEVKFNSLGIEEASRAANLLGGEIETTKSDLDSLGRPNPVKDAEGKVLSAHLLKQAIKSDTGAIRSLAQNFHNGLVDMVFISPEFIGPGIIWQTKIIYDELENEVKTETLAYSAGRFLGQVKYSTTLDKGEGKLYKEEVFASGARQVYEQDAYSGLINNIEITALINGQARTYRIEREYDQYESVQSWQMSLKDNPGLWAVTAQRKAIDKEAKTVSFIQTLANGHQEDVILDAQTGLTRELGFEAETAQDLIASWLTLINYDAQGIEKSRGIYVDKNRDGKIDFIEKKLWVFLSEKES